MSNELITKDDLVGGDWETVQYYYKITYMKEMKHVHAKKERDDRDIEFIFYDKEILARLFWFPLRDDDYDPDKPLIQWALDYKDPKRQLVYAYYVLNFNRMLEMYNPPRIIDSEEPDFIY